MKTWHMAFSMIKIALPLMGGLTAQAAVQIIDTVMLGHYSIEALAAGVVATSVLFLLITVGSGIASAVLALSSSQTQHMRSVTLSAALGLTVIFSAVIYIGMYYSESILLLLGQDSAIATGAKEYLHLAGLGLLPALMTMVLRSHATAIERPNIVLWVSLAALPLNALLNWIFIFGYLGAPEMGIEGAALATFMTHSVSLALTLVYIRIIDASALSLLFSYDVKSIIRVINLSWPIALTNLAELGMFTVSTLIVGSLGEIPVAAHGIVVQITSAAFIVHLAISQVATVKSGQAYALSESSTIRLIGKVASGLSMSAVIVTTGIFVLLPESLVSLFIQTHDSQFQQIQNLAAMVLVIAALSQLVDAMQVIAMGLLRGFQDTRTPMVIAISSYWCIAVPAAYILGKTLEYGVLGVWFGITIGLIGAAGTLWIRFYLLTRGTTFEGLSKIKPLELQ
ncbi:MATE family efflux transporter [Marinomonas sp. 2405UD68-3]|uniref:MATE family efflux transporter n=1 Tax=Marinomonas sp. 2405UD68-3 TaxID=3391835 RepID=UPI0039C8F3BA